MQSALVKELKSYVDHKHMISRNNPHYNKKLWFLTALEKCQLLVRIISVELNNQTIARLILARQKELRSILPDQRNKSFASSEIKLNEIIDRANDLCLQRI